MTKKEAKKLLKDYKDFLNKDHKGMYSKISDYSLNKYIKEQLFIPDVMHPLVCTHCGIQVGQEPCKFPKVCSDKVKVNAN